MTEHSIKYSDDRLNIILVEDDDGDAKAVSRAFAKSDVPTTILRVSDGVEALELLRGDNPPPPTRYVLLIDVNMPRMNGLELLWEIRADPDLKSAIVFIMSTSNDDRDKIAAYRQNVAGYILKDKASKNLARLVNIFEQYWRLVEIPYIAFYE